MKGTAKASRRKVPLGYYLLRRPAGRLARMERPVNPLLPAGFDAVQAWDEGAAAPASLPPVLPALREDLRLMPAAANRDGSPA